MNWYPRQSSVYMSRTQRKKRAILIVCALALTIAVIVFTVVSLRSGGMTGDVRAQLLQSCRESVSAAIGQSNTISSIGGSAAYPRLAQVRQYVYHIEQVNRICASTLGASLTAADIYGKLYTTLDEYTTYVQSGASTTVAQNNLSNQLNQLQQYLNQAN